MYQWYILQVYSGNEKKIEKELLAQLEKKGLKKHTRGKVLKETPILKTPWGKKKKKKK